LAADLAPQVCIVARRPGFSDIRTVLALTITSGVTVLPTEWTGAVVAILGLAVGCGVLVIRWRLIRTTTLVGAWCWALATVVGWSLVELIPGTTTLGVTYGEPLGVAAITLSLCPIIALLGAKRPQHGPWNFVVLSLWIILALPAAETLFLHPGQHVQMGQARAWFLWILIALGPINFVPTRYWLASLLVAAGQVVALSQYLAMMDRPLLPAFPAAGLFLCVVGFVAAELAARRARVFSNSHDHLWISFRDTFGLLWGLRVQERVNAAAKQLGWDFGLAWHGLRRRADNSPLTQIDPSIEPTFRTTFKGLLRRFVSNDWITERLKSDL
jgi:hypothetical protein